MGDGDLEAAVPEAGKLKALLPVRDVADAAEEIEIPAQRAEHVIQRLVVEGHHGDAEGAKALPTVLKGLQERLAGPEPGAADADVNLFRVRELPGPRYGNLRFAPEPQGVLIEGRAGLCQHQAAVRALEERKAQLGLQPVQIVHDGGRGNIERGSGLVHAAVLRHRQEGLYGLIQHVSPSRFRMPGLRFSHILLSASRFT